MGMTPVKDAEPRWTKPISYNAYIKQIRKVSGPLNRGVRKPEPIIFDGYTITADRAYQLPGRIGPIWLTHVTAVREGEYVISGSSDEVASSLASLSRSEANGLGRPPWLKQARGASS